MFFSMGTFALVGMLPFLNNSMELDQYVETIAGSGIYTRIPITIDTSFNFDNVK
jgi:hypothetical protein